MIPTQRSVIARLRYKNLDGGGSEDTLCRASRTKVFPRSAVMERNMFRADRIFSSLSTFGLYCGEQESSFFYLLEYIFSKICCFCHLSAMLVSYVY